MQLHRKGAAARITPVHRGNVVYVKLLFLHRQIYRGRLLGIGVGFCHRHRDDGGACVVDFNFSTGGYLCHRVIAHAKRNCPRGRNGPARAVHDGNAELCNVHRVCAIGFCYIAGANLNGGHFFCHNENLYRALHGLRRIVAGIQLKRPIHRIGPARRFPGKCICLHRLAVIRPAECALAQHPFRLGRGKGVQLCQQAAFPFAHRQGVCHRHGIAGGHNFKGLFHFAFVQQLAARGGRQAHSGRAHIDVVFVPGDGVIGRVCIVGRIIPHSLGRHSHIRPYFTAGVGLVWNILHHTGCQRNAHLPGAKHTALALCLRGAAPKFYYAAVQPQCARVVQRTGALFQHHLAALVHTHLAVVFQRVPGRNRQGGGGAVAVVLYHAQRGACAHRQVIVQHRLAPHLNIGRAVVQMHHAVRAHGGSALLAVIADENTVPICIARHMANALRRHNYGVAVRSGGEGAAAAAAYTAAARANAEGIVITAHGIHHAAADGNCARIIGVFTAANARAAAGTRFAAKGPYPAAGDGDIAACAACAQLITAANACAAAAAFRVYGAAVDDDVTKIGVCTIRAANGRRTRAEGAAARIGVQRACALNGEGRAGLYPNGRVVGVAVQLVFAL